MKFFIFLWVKRGTANMGQWSAKLTFHFNLALGEWEGGGEFQELGNLHISIEFIHFFVDGFAMRSTLGEWEGGGEFQELENLHLYIFICRV